MNDLVHIQNTDISVKEYRGQRVVTFKDIDMVHERPEGTARATFNRNKTRFREGEDYFVCETYEAKSLFNVSAPNGILLLTEQGYLMLVKPFSDDLSWTVQRQLVNGYFKTMRLVNEELSPETQLILKLAQSIANKELKIKSETGRLPLRMKQRKRQLKPQKQLRKLLNLYWIIGGLRLTEKLNAFSLVPKLIFKH